MLCLEEPRKRAENLRSFWTCCVKAIALSRWRCWWMTTPAIPMNGHSHWGEDLDIQLRLLRKRSPYLNPLGQLWGCGKAAVCANYQDTPLE